MFVLVSYDVQTSDPDGPKRLRRVAKVCRDYGQPRPRMGGDVGRFVVLFVEVVSIHAPAWGATVEPQLTAAIRHFTAFPRFNPHP